MAKGWFRDLPTPMKPTESTPPTTTTTTSSEWVIFFREAFFIPFFWSIPSLIIPLLRLYRFFFLLFCLGYFLSFDPRDVVLSGYLCYMVQTTLKKLIYYLENAETPSRAFLAPISIHAGILGLLLSLPSPRHFISTSFDPPLFVLDGILFSYYSLIGLPLHLSRVQILKKIMKPMLKTLAISLKNKGIISVSSKHESRKNREQKRLVDFDSTNNSRAWQSGLLSVEDLQQHCGGRPDAAAKSFRVWRPPDQHGEGNTSTARETPSHNVQTGMEGEPIGQNQEAKECRRDFMERKIALNTESGLIMVSRPPDQHGERNTSTASETPSHNVQTGIEGVPVGQNQEANEFRRDCTEGSIPLNTENGLIIAARSQPVATILTERQDTWSVKVMATYGDSIIKFLLLLTSGIKELMQEVSLTLDCVLGSFNFDYMDEDEDDDCFLGKKVKGIDLRFTLENLQQYFGQKRKDVAASLGVSVSTFKRKCRLQGITQWQNQMGSSTGSVSKPPDQHGQRNPPSTCKTLSTNGQTEMENEMVGHLAEMNEFLLDFDDGPNGRNMENASKLPTFQDSCPSIFSVSSMYNENEEAGVSSEWPSQLRNQWTVSTAHPNSSGLVVPHPHMASQILGENMGSLEEWGSSFASLEEPLLPSHDSGSMSTVPPCSYPVPSQPMPTIPHTLGSSEDRRNSLAFLEDVFPEEHVSGSLLASVEDVSLEEHVHTMGSSDDLRNLLASAEEHFSAGHVFGFINQIVPSCFDPAPSQSMPNTLHTMPPIPHMMPLLAERQDTRSVMLKAMYGDITIKFQLPLTCGIGKLKEEVSKRLECEPGSYHVEYKDEDGTWIIINCDEDVRIFLYLFTSLGNQVIKLRVRDKVPNTTKFCQCGHAADH